VPALRRRVGVDALVTLGLALGGCGSADVKAKPPPLQGSDPVAWAGALCSGGYGGVFAGMTALANSQPTPQGQKDGLLALSDSVQKAFANAAHKLEQLGPPRITDGKRVHDTAVNFFTTTAETIRGQRAKLAVVDANDPDFVQKVSHLPGPDIGAASAQLRELTSNKELEPAIRAAPECQRQGSGVGPR
jgi:hypothetical protein